MTIYGTGIDLVNITRFKKVMKNNIKFKKRIFSQNEINYCEKNKNKYNCYAKRFSAKEAFSKSLGTGISEGLCFNEIIINNNKKEKPTISIKGKSLTLVTKILNKKKFNIFLSLSDEGDYAISSVILTA